MNRKYNLKINNFGPIKNANLEITPLTIFVGSNNSGKSFSAKLIHSLLNPFDNYYQNMDMSLSIKPLDLLMKNEKLFEEFDSMFMEYLDSDIDFFENPFKFPKDKFNDLVYFGIGQYYLDSVENKLKNNFNKDLNKLNNIMSNAYFDITFNEISLENIGGNLKLDNFFFKSFNMDKSSNSKGDLILSITDEENYISITLNMLYFNMPDMKREFIPFLVYSLLANVFIHNVKKNSYYIPASSYAISYDLNSSLAQEINGTINSSNIDKELMNLLLDNKNTKEGFFNDISRDMSKEILDGIFVFDDINKGIKFIDKENNEFEFSLVSSSIKELAPLIKYLADLSQKDDTLIIEEPENHLHPNNQRILVKYLVKLVNQGLNIILTTHSDYILEQFNNFIRLGEVNSDVLNELGYSEDIILNHEDIKIYNFKKEGNHCYVPEEVEINETGFIDDNFSKVTDELYDESVNIIDSMGR